MRDERMGFMADVSLPTGPDGVELIEPREGS